MIAATQKGPFLSYSPLFARSISHSLPATHPHPHCPSSSSPNNVNGGPEPEVEDIAREGGRPAVCNVTIQLFLGCVTHPNVQRRVTQPSKSLLADLCTSILHEPRRIQKGLYLVTPPSCTVPVFRKQRLSKIAARSIFYTLI